VELVAAQGFALAIVTGAQRDDVLAVLEHSPVGELFGVLVAEEDVSRGKPDPEGYLTAAGMPCIAVSAEPQPELAALAPVVVRSLTAGLVEDVLSRRPPAT
jgi:hypothetical protein